MNKFQIKKIGVLFLIITFSISIVACNTLNNDVEEKDNNWDTIKDVQEIDSIKVRYGTSSNIVIEYYLPKKATLTLDNDEKVKGEVAWEAPDNYDKNTPGTYEFKGKATYKNINYENINVKVEVAKEDENLIKEITVSNVPQSLTGSKTANTQKINTENIMTSSDQSTWGHFEMIPQTGNNYNDWVNRRKITFDKLINLDSDTVKSELLNRSYSINYQKINHPIFDEEFNFINKDDKLEIRFLKTSNNTKFLYIRKMLDRSETQERKEIRLLFHEEKNKKIHDIAVYYRKNVSNMNDVVEAYEKEDIEKIKSFRVYHIGEDDESKYNFAGITELNTGTEKTTAYNYSNKRPENYYGIFNKDNLLIEENSNSEKLNLPKGYPLINDVINFYDSGINSNIAKQITINENLETNLINLLINNNVISY